MLSLHYPRPSVNGVVPNTEEPFVPGHHKINSMWFPIATFSSSDPVRERSLPIDISPTKITGAWDDGYCLDRHTISSTMIGYNEFGHPEFDTQRSALGELIYRLKYKGDIGSIPSIVETAARFIREMGHQPRRNHSHATIKTASRATSLRNCFCTGLYAWDSS
jgi:hypothetical protein